MSDYKPSAAEIKQLRNKTLAGFQDCQKALAEAAGDMTTAEEIIKKKGLQVAAKKAHRDASDGLIATIIADDHLSGSLVEVNTETDFAAKNEEFIGLTKTLAAHVLANGPDEVTDGSAMYDVATSDGKTVKELIDTLIGKIGENMGLKRAVRFSASDSGVVHAYIHPPGKVGVLVELGFDDGVDTAKANELAHELALQIAFADPAYICPEDIPEDVVAKERELCEGKAREQGKPDHIVPKIAEGMLRKYYSEECLLEQPYAKEPKQCVKDFMKSFGLPGASVKRYARFALK